MSAAQWPAMPGALVIARFARIHGDGTDDDDRPDWIAPEGTELSFVPSITGPLVYDPTGERIIVEVAPFRAVVDSNGFAVAKDGGHPIKLAPTDDPMMSRTGWLWTCSWAGGKVSFPAPSSGTVNLADFIVAPPDNPVVEEWVARIPEMVDVAGSLVSIDTVTEDTGDIVVTLTDGEVYRFPMPKGDTGTDGRGIESITDDDEDGIATVLYTDGAVDALPLPRGPQGDSAPMPEIAWVGDVLTVDGVSSPPLSGPAGPAPATSWSGTSLIVGDNPPVDLQGPIGADPIYGFKPGFWLNTQRTTTSELTDPNRFVLFPYDLGRAIRIDRFGSLKWSGDGDLYVAIYTGDDLDGAGLAKLAEFPPDFDYNTVIDITLPARFWVALRPDGGKASYKAANMGGEMIAAPAMVGSNNSSFRRSAWAAAGSVPPTTITAEANFPTGTIARPALAFRLHPTQP